MSKRLIGLTGGIATGKTTVSKYLSQRYRLSVLDADVYAREAVALNSPILQNIFARYGESVILPDRSLNRPGLGEIVFTNPIEKQWLESQIHPYVRDRFQQQLESINDGTILIDIPRIFED
ncbi:MAG: dephospho-CoA kinase, partial [Pleurocapsa sp.]